jgi:CubicO group peptidase (beta-lactamase class C family)
MPHSDTSLTIMQLLRSLPVVLLLLMIMNGQPLHTQPSAGWIPDSVMAAIRTRVDNTYTPGIIIGVVDKGGTHYYSYGRGSAAGDSINERTVFEIGSATKAFTGILLAQMIERGDVRLNDPISLYIPQSAGVPASTGDSITLLQLATHTSGLPRLPSNLNPANMANPYADYSVQDLYSFLDSVEPGPKKYEYSNVGMGLLGHLLARHADRGYEELLRERILLPLGLDDTGITLSDDQMHRLARGHSGSRQVANWDFSTLPGAGALRSTAHDMLRFLAANIGLIETPLNPVLRAAHMPRAEVGMQQMQIGLGWHIRPARGATYVWHNGGTGGYHSFMAFDPKEERGVVVLTNSDIDIDDLGWHILDTSVPLQPVRPVAKIDPKLLDSYVGRYQFSPDFSMDITREGDHIYVEPTGQQQSELYPTSDTRFFLIGVDAEISFTRNSTKKAESLTLHQNGMDQVAQRVR